MKIAIYTPYLDSFGGGERYTLTVAESLSAESDVDLFLDKHLISLNPEKLVEELEKRFNLDLSKVKLVPAPVGIGSDFVSRLFFLKKYDLLFYLTDGSIFFSTARRNLIHFQVPFKNTVANLLGNWKLSSWDLAVCNSEFTKRYIEKEWPIKCTVLYPPVSVEEIKPLKKKKQILSVGRFNTFLKSKKHDLIITAFCDLFKSGKLEGWSLHLAGSVEGERSYIDELKKLAGNAPVIFYPDLPFQDLMKLYGESSIYWHAAGFGETDPTKMEHFGITTVEAMAAGCVPVVINKGGQPEIVKDQQSGLLWDTTYQLKLLTIKLINDPRLMSQLSQGAISRSRMFSKTNFQQQIKSLIRNPADA